MFFFFPKAHVISFVDKTGSICFSISVFSISDFYPAVGLLNKFMRRRINSIFSDRLSKSTINSSKWVNVAFETTLIVSFCVYKTWKRINFSTL